MRTFSQSRVVFFLGTTLVLVLCLGCANINQGANAPDNTAQQLQTLREQTATQDPCPSYAIQIAPNYIINKSDGSASWTAVCYGDVYQCTRGGKDLQNVTCEQTEPQPVK